MLQGGDFWTKIFYESLSFTHARSVHDYYVGACAFFEWKITREHTDFRRISSLPRHTLYYSIRCTFLFIFFRLPLLRSLHPNPSLLSAGSLEVQRHCRTATEHAWTCASRALSSIKLNRRMGRSCNGLRLWRQRRTRLLPPLLHYLCQWF